MVFLPATGLTAGCSWFGAVLNDDGVGTTPAAAEGRRGL